jgi:[ribosomal protein S5]-alanine N-acetyltransferase
MVTISEQMGSGMQYCINNSGFMHIDLTIKTDRLFLRPLTVDDIEIIWPHVSNPEIPKYMSWDAHMDKTETQKFLERIHEDMADGKSILWAIFLKEQFCGIISLISIIRRHRSLTYDKAELAYWLAPKYQKQGIMTEAGKAVIGVAFQKLGFHRLTVSHMPENKASENLIKKWQFRYIGEEREAFMKNAKWHNHKLYELLVSDYKMSL